MATVVLARDARHEGRRVRVPARPAARARRRRARRRRRRARAGRARARRLRARRSRARPAPTSPRSPRRATAARPSPRWRAGAEADRARAARRGPARRDPRARRLGRLVDRGAGDARAAGRRAEAARLDRRLRRHAAVRRCRRRDDDVLGRRHLRRQPRLGADHGQRRGCDRGHGRGDRAPRSTGKPLVAATMFGVTTPCVTTARERLEELGYEVLVFHATGAGGQSMEALAKDGFLAGVLDATTTELADELVGGVLSAGPDRLEAAGAAGVPQVVSLGALDMVNFGPRETVPSQFDERNLYVHNPTVTLMRTTPDECAELGRTIGRKLSGATGPTALFVPLGGVSMIDDARAAVPRRRGRRGARRRPAARRSATSVEVHERERGRQRPRVRDGDGRPPARADPGGAHDDARRGARPAARAGRRAAADHRRRRRNGPLGEARRGGRRRPDHHLQQRPLPDGRPRLARRADAVRRRERDRRRHGARGAAGRRARRRCSPACAAPIRSG